MSFEDIKMEEDELFDEFYAKLNDIMNSAFNLGETIPEPKIVKKVLRSLLERFHAEITAIEESKDIWLAKNVLNPCDKLTNKFSQVN